MEQFTFFWHGPFSQWHASSFTLYGITYVTAEQWMMAEKARVFGDENTWRRIMETKLPKAQKALGRIVEGFNDHVWSESAKKIVKRGNMAKFSQNEILGELLASTAGTTLVEASPYDKIWGIGLNSNDERAKSRSSWLGQNLLGEILTEIRIEMFGR